MDVRSSKSPVPDSFLSTGNSAARLAAYLRATTDAVYIMSPEWGEMRRLAGGGFLADTTAPNTSWMDEYIPEDGRPAVMKAIRRAIKQGKMFELEHPVCRADGTRAWTLSRAVPLRNEAGQIVEWVGSASDNTAAHEKQELQNSLAAREVELRTLNKRLMTSQDDERRRVARELHDDLSQRMALLSMEVACVTGLLEGDCGEARKKLQQIDKIVSTTSSDLRRLSHRLHPSMLEHLGITTALEELAQEFAHREGKSVTFKSRLVPEDVSTEVSMGLYRIAQEALRNIAKHAGGGEVQITLSKLKRNLQLRIADNGKGFSLRSRKPGLGLISMRERAEMLGGTLTIESSPAQGTALTVLLPLTKIKSGK